MLFGGPLIILSLFSTISPVISSVGERSPLYQKCFHSCMVVNCTEDGVEFQPHKAALQEQMARTLLWSCKDECSYHCMWNTVTAFQERKIPVPKFYGKWPFKRSLGVQEPASAIFSAFNLAAHIHMYLKIARDPRFVVGVTPMLFFWNIFCAICSHAWLWSIVFHTRDTPFTEFMDYACALSMVMAHFVAAVVRIFHSRRVVALSILAGTLFYYVEHVKYLHRGFIDYSFNIVVNVTVGVAGSALWLSWAVWRMRKEGPPAHYSWRLIAFVLGSAVTLLLELCDFPPIASHFDAHALWHLTTAPLPLWFYRFVMDDMDYLQSTVQERKTGEKVN